MSNKSKATSVPVIINALKKAGRFMSGFEDDETQNGVKSTLKLIAKAIKLAEESTDKIVIEVEGGLVQEVYTDLAQVEYIVCDRDNESNGEKLHCGRWQTPEPVGTAPADIQKAASL